MTNVAAKGAKSSPKPTAPTPSQRAWLARGLDQAGGKLPLFDLNGRKVSPRTVRTCMGHGWVAPWFMNPTKPDWIVCRLTDLGRELAKTT